MANRGPDLDLRGPGLLGNPPPRDRSGSSTGRRGEVIE
jgi:hypothetical protein